AAKPAAVAVARTSADVIRTLRMLSSPFSGQHGMCGARGPWQSAADTFLMIRVSELSAWLRQTSGMKTGLDRRALLLALAALGTGSPALARDDGDRRKRRRSGRHDHERAGVRSRKVARGRWPTSSPRCAP